MPQASRDNKIGLGARVAGFLRERYSDNCAKKIAGEFRVSVGTAKRWLRGITPTTAIIEEMASRWGIPFVTVAFADYIVAADEDALEIVKYMKEEQESSRLRGALYPDPSTLRPEDILKITTTDDGMETTIVTKAGMEITIIRGDCRFEASPADEGRLREDDPSIGPRFAIRADPDWLPALSRLLQKISAARPWYRKLW